MCLPNVVLEQLNALSQIYAQAWSVAATANSGLSSSCVYRIDVGSHIFALRDWNWLPNRYHELGSKLQFQRRLHQHWSFQPTIDSLSIQLSPSGPSLNPIPPVLNWPNGDLILTTEQSMWTLSDWVPGCTVDFQEASASHLTSLADALARMHQVSGQCQTRVAFSQGWEDRVHMLTRIQQRLGDQQPDGDNRFAALTYELLARSQQVGLLERLRSLAIEEAAKKHLICWIVRDCHWKNWLFQTGHVSAYVDFGAAREDWPGWDIVRLLSSIEIDSAERQSFLEDYGRSFDRGGPFSTNSESVQRLSDEAYWKTLSDMQLLLSLYQWMEWSEARSSPLRDLELDRWNELLRKAQRQLV